MVTETKPRIYSEDERRQIIEMHLDAHDGIFRPQDLVEEAVRHSHPAMITSSGTMARRGTTIGFGKPASLPV